MTFQGILNRLMEGDVRTIIFVGLVAFLIFIVVRFLREASKPYAGLIKLLLFFGIATLVCIWVVDPNRAGSIVYTVAGWITNRVEPFFS